MKTQLQKSITNILHEHPLLKGVPILVTVNDHDVMLTGTADVLSEKMLAEELAKKSVHNINIINEIEVLTTEPSDTASILNEITAKFKTNFGDSYTNIDIGIRNGHVRLKGQMKWKYQQQLATDCITKIPGIKSIANDITVPSIETALTSDEVLEVIKSVIPINTAGIQIEVLGHKVTLTGMVDFELHKDLVDRVVRNISGVLEVENLLRIN